MLVRIPVQTGRTLKSCFASVPAMPPIAKENELLTAMPDTGTRPAANAVSAEPTYKPQPVALEVSVTVNGARTVDGSDKREPFSETTKTVLVFGNGAVIRLSSSVAPGQLLFLTNEKTKKEVVCQVVKSKNYRNVSGYVELEFTESVIGFWGMRFPGDRIAPASASTVPGPQAFGSPAAGGAPPISRTVAPRVETSAPTVSPSIFPGKPSVSSPVAINTVSTTPKRVEEATKVKPVAPVAQITPAKSTSFDPEAALNSVPVQPVADVSPVFDAPRASDAQASIFAPPSQSPAIPSAIEALTFSSVADAKPAVPATPLASNPETEALKQHTARLQEQLSSMLFTEAPPEKPAVNAPAPKASEPVALDAATKILEIAKTEPAPLPVKQAEPPKRTSLPAKSTLDDGELQIPAWLEPLARNAAAPVSTQELIEREKAKRLAEQAKVEKAEEIFEEISSPATEEQIPELQTPSFGNTLSFEQNQSTGESSSKGSGKGLMFAAIAAGVLLLAGGAWWYMRLPSSGAATSASALVKSQSSTSVPGVPAPADSLQPQSSAVLPASSPVQSSPADRLDPSSQAKPSQNGAGLVSGNGSAASARNDKAAISSASGGTSPVAVSTSQPAAAQPKKPSLGEVRLATPTVTKRGRAQDNSEADAALALSSDQPESSSDAFAAGLAVNTKGPAAPAAPIPVGGDVRSAKLLSSVPPAYPTLAKNQHVSGNVLIDALIDATGHVTTMKVVSGPTLLHQAAMDALKQWKYQPAMLDGKPVPMHLTVTIQFRLQ
jgi:TonB family protein